MSAHIAQMAKIWMTITTKWFSNVFPDSVQYNITEFHLLQQSRNLCHPQIFILTLLFCSVIFKSTLVFILMSSLQRHLLQLGCRHCQAVTGYLEVMHCCSSHPVPRRELPTSSLLWLLQFPLVLFRALLLRAETLRVEALS